MQTMPLQTMPLLLLMITIQTMPLKLQRLPIFVDGLIDVCVDFFVFVVFCLNPPAIRPWHIGNQSTEHVIDSGPLQISSYKDIGEGVFLETKKH